MGEIKIVRPEDKHTAKKSKMQLKTFIILASLALVSAKSPKKSRNRADKLEDFNQVQMGQFRVCVFQERTKPNYEKFSEECKQLKNNCQKKEYREANNYENKKACKVALSVRQTCMQSLNEADRKAMRKCKNKCYRSVKKGEELDDEK